MAEIAPSVLGLLYRGASSRTVVDHFVAGPSGHGYTFPSRLPDLEAWVGDMVPALVAADLDIVSILDDADDMSSCDAYLERAEVAGAFYKDYSDYSRFGGAIRWHEDKPCVSYRHVLWNNQDPADSPESVADAINAAPFRPWEDENSFSLVNVHAWSEWDFGWSNVPTDGPIEAIIDTVTRLHPHVRVVSGNQMIALLRQMRGNPLDEEDHPPVALRPNFAPRTFEAENEASGLVHPGGLGHVGREGTAWCSTVDEGEARFLIAGPSVRDIQPGSPHVVRFWADIDVNAGEDEVIILEVYDQTTDRRLTARAIVRNEFPDAGELGSFDIEFVAVGNHRYEFRVFYNDGAAICIDRIEVDPR